MIDLLAQVAAKKQERENANSVPPQSNTDAFGVLTQTLKQSTPQTQSIPSPASNPVNQQGTQPVVQPAQTAGLIVATDQGNIAVEDIGKFQFSTQPEQASANATEQFRLHLNAMTAALNDDSLPDNIRRTMDFLDANPQMKDILMPDDVQEIVRACRKSYGGAVKKKVKRRTKKSETERQANEMVDMLGADFLKS
ncbi:MAG: hypothetical protein KAJ10_16535 [Thermodesulfovibrionia bacterium]|nr:hypothetical protein [Thermodesulfovibrionia bacterium]